MKSKLKVETVGLLVAAGWPVVSGGLVCPKPVAYATSSSPATAGLAAVTCVPSACVIMGAQGVSNTLVEAAGERMTSHAVRM